MKLDLKEIVKNNYCYLTGVSSEFAYYDVDIVGEKEIKTFRFSIPLNDIGTTMLGQREKAIILMRWIRKTNENDELIFIKQETIPQKS